MNPLFLTRVGDPGNVGQQCSRQVNVVAFKSFFRGHTRGTGSTMYAAGPGVPSTK